MKGRAAIGEVFMSNADTVQRRRRLSPNRPMSAGIPNDTGLCPP